MDSAIPGIIKHYLILVQEVAFSDTEAHLLSPGSELLLKAYRKELCKRIDLDASDLLNGLQTVKVLTFKEAQTIKVNFLSILVNRINNLCCHYVFRI